MQDPTSLFAPPTACDLILEVPDRGKAYVYGPDLPIGLTYRRCTPSSAVDNSSSLTRRAPEPYCSFSRVRAAIHHNVGAMRFV